ncbi:hypothetical protein L0337_01410 [candidate division KSB1 bacterium]|nr:hypothetical protein [candidate division KSB1 bacterium]
MKKAKLIKKSDKPTPQPKQPARREPRRGGPAVDPRVIFAALFNSKK